MREFGRFSQRSPPQITLQAGIPVILSIVWANFRDFQQCSHSDSALNPDRLSLYPIPVSFFSSVSVLSAVTIGECSYSPVNSTWTSRSTARQIEYNRHANAK